MSFFKKLAGSSSPTSGKKNSGAAFTPSGQGTLYDVIMCLVQTANDQDSTVAESVADSLCAIGAEKPQLVLTTVMDFVQGSKKVVGAQRGPLLRIMSRVLKAKGAAIDGEQAEAIARFAVGEVTREKNVSPWQASASAVLVELGASACDVVVDAVLRKFDPGTVPHYYVLKTLGDVATANPVDFTIRCRDVLPRMLPIISLLKPDSMKWVYAYAMSHFAFAITEAAARGQGSAQRWASEMLTTFEVMFNHWLSSRDSKLRLATVEALGAIVGVLSSDHVAAQLPKLVPAVLAMYKKEKETERLAITRSVRAILDVGVREHGRVLTPLLTQVLNALHPIACTAPNVENENSVANYTSLLEAYELLVQFFTDETLDNLQGKLDARDANSRAGALRVLRHLILHQADRMQPRREKLISALKALDGEQDLYVVKAICQTVYAMAQQGYLGLIGGTKLLAFVVRQCAISESAIAAHRKKHSGNSGSAAELSPVDIKEMAEQQLWAMTTTIPAMESVLWPFLFEFLIPEEYTSGVGTVCKQLAFLAKKLCDDGNSAFHIEFDRAQNVPPPQAIVVRLLTLLTQPHFGSPEFGVDLLRCMQAIAPNLHPNIETLWNKHVPALLHYLDEHMAGALWQQAAWDDVITRFIGETLGIVGKQEWLRKAGREQSAQLASYDKLPALKRMAFKFLGVTLQRVEQHGFVQEMLNTMFKAVSHVNEHERQGSAQGFGYAAAAHLDLVLEKLEKATKNDAVKKSTGFMGFLKDKSTADVDNIKGTILMCYGYTTAYAPADLMVSRVDVHVAGAILKLAADAKSQALKESIVRSIDLVGKSMHAEHLDGLTFQLKDRDALVEAVLGFMSARDVTLTMRALGLNACSTLAQLAPPLPDELVAKLISRTSALYDIVAKGKDAASKEEAIEASLANFNQMLGSILVSNALPSTLTQLLEHIESFVASAKVHQKQRACTSILFLCKRFVEDRISRLQDGTRTGGTELPRLGHFLGLLVGRTTDSELAIRQTAAECLQTLLFIGQMFDDSDAVGVDGELTPLPEIAHFTDLRNRLVSSDQAAQVRIVNELAAVLAKLVPEKELEPMITALLCALHDDDEKSAIGACVAINGILKTRGSELRASAGTVTHEMLESMGKIQSDTIMNGTLNCLRTLARSHFEAVVNEILAWPLPLNEHAIMSLQTIAADEGLVYTLLDHLTEVMNNSPLWSDGASGSGGAGAEEKKKKKKGQMKDSRVPHLGARAATSALGELLDIEGMYDVVNERYAQVVASLMLRFGTLVEVGGGEHSAHAIDAFEKLAECVSDEQITAMFTANSEVLKMDEYPEALSSIVCAIAIARPDQVVPIFDFLLPFITRQYDGQRIVTTTVFAEFVGHARGKQDLLDKLINVLLARAGDEHAVVRRYALRGLGNISSVGEEGRHASITVIGALLSGFDDADGDVAVEAVKALVKAVSTVEVADMGPMLFNTVTKLRSAFARDIPAMRAAAFELFGKLHRFADGANAASLTEQVQTAVPYLFVHLADDSLSVKESVRRAMKRVAPLVGGDDVLALWTGEQATDNEQYDAFVDKAVPHILAALPERVDGFLRTLQEMFKSDINFVKANAVYLAGLFLFHLPADKRTSPTSTSLATAMLNLLKQPSAHVRARAAKGLSFLYQF